SGSWWENRERRDRLCGRARATLQFERRALCGFRMRTPSRDHMREAVGWPFRRGCHSFLYADEWSPRMNRRDVLRTGLASLSAAALPLGALAQAKYPGRPIKLLIPFSPGWVTD